MIRVQSLGEYADPTPLVGEVKLEEGQYIKITRNDSHNSLVIEDTRPIVPNVSAQLFSGVGPGHEASVPSPTLTIS